MNERTSYKIITAERDNISSDDNTDLTHALRLKLCQMGVSFNGLTQITGTKRVQCFLVARDTQIQGVTEISGSFYLSSKNNAVGQESYLTFWEDGKEWFLNYRTKVKGEERAESTAS